MSKERKDVVRMNLNGHRLLGHKWNGLWRWICTFPELAVKYSGRGDSAECVTHFLALAEQVCPPAELPPRRAG